MKSAPPLLTLLPLLLGGAPLAAQQSCDLSAYPLSSPSSRFEDHADGTVTDKESKLMWMRCSTGQTYAAEGCSGEAERLSWPAAQALAAEVNQRGSFFFKDWRVPQLRELATIAERQCTNPRVNLAVFPRTPAERYWTTTHQPGGANESFAFALSFGAGGIALRAKEETSHLRLVRSAQ